MAQRRSILWRLAGKRAKPTALFPGFVLHKYDDDDFDIDDDDGGHD